MWIAPYANSHPKAPGPPHPIYGLISTIFGKFPGIKTQIFATYLWYAIPVIMSPNSLSESYLCDNNPSKYSTFETRPALDAGLSGNTLVILNMMG